MGVKKKEHRKKVERRNQRLKSEKNKIQKLFDESIKKQIEEYKEKMSQVSGDTINQENEVGFVQSDANIQLQ